MSRIARRLTYANVIATLALFVALGGTAAGAKVWITGDDVRNGSLTGMDVANRSLAGKKLRLNAVTGAVVRDGTLHAADFDPADLARMVGPQGPQGPAGTTGSKGDQGPKGDPGSSDITRLSWSAPALPGYASGTTILSQSVPSFGGWLVWARTTVTNTGATDENINCGLAVSGGSGFGGGGDYVPAGATKEINTVGFGPAGPSQTIELACFFGGGSFDLGPTTVSLGKILS